MLAKAGWYGGSPSAVDAAPVDEVIYSYHYEMFCRQYENAVMEMNKAEK